MNKVLILVSLLFLIISAGLFTEGGHAQEAPPCKVPGDVNPNGSSELSLLMRKMEAHAVATRKAVLAKKTPPVFPKEFATIYVAQPTDSNTKSPAFNPFADGYLLALYSLTSSTHENVVQNYNGLVNSCISCHNQHCPGPISRIKKLLITEAVK